MKDARKANKFLRFAFWLVDSWKRPSESLGVFGDYG